jgi:hypothetical protein
MERLFSPCTRYREIAELRGGRDEFRRHQYLEEPQELNLDVSTEELLSAESAFTYADLYATMGNRNTVAWLTPHAAVVREQGFLGFYCLHQDNLRFQLNVDGKTIEGMADSSEALSEIIDVVRRLLLAGLGEVYKAGLTDLGRHNAVFFDAPTLTHLMEQCRNLKVLTFCELHTLG